MVIYYQDKKGTDKIKKSRRPPRQLLEGKIKYPNHENFKIPVLFYQIPVKKSREMVI